MRNTRSNGGLRAGAICLPILFASACVGPLARQSCDVAIPLRDGWLGGDAVYSVALGGGGRRDALWLFGDTFVGQHGASTRRGSAFVHNSVARSHCSWRGFQLDYAWGVGEDGRPTAVFTPNEEGVFWWPFDGVMLDDALHVALLRVRPPTPGSGDLGFGLEGVDLGRVRNHRDPPARWRVESVPMSRRLDGVEAFTAGALAVDGPYLYVFSFLKRGGGRHPRFLVRFGLDRVRAFDGDLAGAVETLQEDGKWIAGFEPERARILMDDDATEMSVIRLADGRWRAVYSFPHQPDVPADRHLIRERTADRLQGPWSSPRDIYRAVPPTPRSEGVETICYAGKEHPGVADPAARTLTYVCNLVSSEPGVASPAFAELLDDLSIYRPIVVRLPGGAVGGAAQRSDQLP